MSKPQKLITVFIMSSVLACSLNSFAADGVPDGIYNLVVGGKKEGIAIVENNKFTRPIKVGVCLFDSTTGDVFGDDLVISIPQKCLAHSFLDLKNNTGPLQFQKSTSFYLNGAITSTDINNPTINLSTGLFLKDHAVYSDGFLDTKNNRYDRGDSRIERDIPVFDSKLSIGDLNTMSGSSLIIDKKLVGFKLGRYWVQNPDRAASVYYTPSHIITIENQSTVEIYRDGQLVDRRILGAGEYNIKNLPVAAYAALLKIKITDSFGMMKETEIDVINPPQLLSKGTFDYSLASGFERVDYKGLGKYSKLIGSGYVGYGFYNWLSMFVSASDRIITATTSIASPIGSISGELRINKINNWRVAYNYSYENIGINAEYKLHNDVKNINTNIFVGMNQYGSLTARYTKLNKDVFGLQHSVSLPISLSLMTTLDFDTKENIGYGINISKQLSNRLSVQISYSKELDKSTNIFAQLTFNLDRSKPTSVGVQASSNTINDVTHIQTRTEARNGLYASVLTNTTRKTPTTTTATVAGSLACADGICRVGEPVSGSFAVGDNLETTGVCGSVIPIPAYYNTQLTATTRTSTESKYIALRLGQGIKFSTVGKVSVEAFVTIDGKPANMVPVTWKGGETVTGEDGLLWLDRMPKEPIIITVGGKQVILMLDGEVPDEVFKVSIGI